jgi:hypothetical protein
MKESFFQLQKFDEFQGIATGVLAAQELDRDNEILDYAGSKPYFQAWAESQYKASGGKSWGNVRLQHDPKRPVGRLLNMSFDDVNKQVRIVAKIEETEAKNLLASGVLTGFSVGGSYIKQTPMGNGVVKYIAGPAEVSVCDRPCGPSATFESVKADGSRELRKFAKPMQMSEQQAVKLNSVRSLAKAGFTVSEICAGTGCTAGFVSRAMYAPGFLKVAQANSVAVAKVNSTRFTKAHVRGFE